MSHIVIFASFFCKFQRLNYFQYFLCNYSLYGIQKFTFDRIIGLFESIDFLNKSTYKHPKVAQPIINLINLKLIRITNCGTYLSKWLFKWSMIFDGFEISSSWNIKHCPIQNIWNNMLMHLLVNKIFLICYCIVVQQINKPTIFFLSLKVIG